MLADAYDPRSLPVARKRSALIGMGMTERQGGSDVRANMTRAEPDAGGAWRITGHKWFFSAPQCDAHLVLAQSSAGLGCFLMPRLEPDGSRNAIRINRLKDKLGNRSNASAKSSSSAHSPGRSVRPIAASRRSSEWSKARGWIASLAAPGSSVPRSPGRCITRGIGRRSAGVSSIIR